MKREEFIYKITAILNNNYPEYSDQTNKYNAKDILLLVEKLGMQPPLTEVKVVSDEARPGTMKHTESVRRWDDE